MMSNRQRITLLIYSMTNAVIFGAGVIAVFSLPSLNADAAFWIPVVVVASFILAAPVDGWSHPGYKRAMIDGSWRGKESV